MRADQRKRGKAPRRVPLKRRDRRCLEDQARGSKPEEGERRRIGRRSRRHREQHGRAGVLITARGGGERLVDPPDSDGGVRTNGSSSRQTDACVYRSTAGRGLVGVQTGGRNDGVLPRTFCGDVWFHRRLRRVPA
jgi:hypothetical protein